MSKNAFHGIMFLMFLCLLSFCYSGRGKKSGTWFPFFLRLLNFNGWNSLFVTIYTTFISFFFFSHRTQITPIFRRMRSSENELWICFFFTLVLQFIWTHLLCCSAFGFCNPEKDPHLCTSLITATAFHVIFVLLTLPKAHVMRLYISMGLLVVW